jgi:hypothetical protein
MKTKFWMITSLLFTAALSFLLISVLSFAQAAEKDPATNIKKADSNLLQFRAGKHIIGFAPNKAYLAGMDHALTIEFLGTKGVMPKADNVAVSTKRDQVQPLGKVTYENLWPGISLKYKAAKSGITESIYNVDPGADVSRIRLKYNVPVEIQKNGSLRFKFSNGYMTESAPVAWQDIKGKKAFVKVRFKLKNGELGFKTNKYNKKYPLIIDPTYEWNGFAGKILGKSMYDGLSAVSGGQSKMITLIIK